MSAPERRAATAPVRAFIVAGESSGDELGASFVRAWRASAEAPPLEVLGIGGPALAAEGQASLFPMADIAVMGFSAVLRRLPSLLARIRTTAAAAIETRPDILLTIDSPDFSHRVARRVRLRAPDVPVMHWVAPSVWAWRPGRAKAMKAHVDRLLALLPFEPDVVEGLGGPPTSYVGHPLRERAPSFRSNGGDPRSPLVVILPGSRSSEVDRLLPLFGEAAASIRRIEPRVRFVLPAVSHLRSAIEANVARWDVPVEVVEGEAAKHAAFREARAALAASGTVTLELALARVPTVVAYKVGAVEAQVAKRLIRVDSVVLPNIIAKRRVFPEYLQGHAKAATLALAVLERLPDGPGRTEAEAAMDAVAAALALPGGATSADLAVEAVRATLGVPRTRQPAG